MKTIIARATFQFTKRAQPPQNWPADKRFFDDYSGESVVVTVSPAPQRVPDWVGDTVGYQRALKDGSITEIEVKSPVPTISQPFGPDLPANTLIGPATVVPTSNQPGEAAVIGGERPPAESKTKTQARSWDGGPMKASSSVNPYGDQLPANAPSQEVADPTKPADPAKPTEAVDPFNSVESVESAEAAKASKSNKSDKK